MIESYNLKLSVQSIIILDKALKQMPYGEVAGLINEINNQIKKQQEDFLKSSQPLDENGIEIK